MSAANAQQKQDPSLAFEEEKRKAIAGYRDDREFRDLSLRWLEEALRRRYTYNFTWLGRPVIQTPADIYMVQELVWQVKPDLVIETGIAHGGSLILSASILAMLDYAEAFEKGETLDPKKPKRRVLGVDIDIRAHNRAAVEAHPMAPRIDMIQGSSVAPEVVEQVKAAAKGKKSVLILLDSNHTHEHVLAELEAYAPLTTPGSYCVACDGIIEDLPADFYTDRPWGPGDNAKTAAHEYVRRLKAEGRAAADGKPLKLEIDHAIEDKLMTSVSPDGFLKRV